jgi:hypothetical protein
MTTILALSAVVGGCGSSNEKDGADEGNAGVLVVIPPVPEHVGRMAEDASLNPATDTFYSKAPNAIDTSN